MPWTLDANNNLQWSGPPDPSTGGAPFLPANQQGAVRRSLQGSGSASGGNGGGGEVSISPESLFGPQNLTTTSIQELPDWLKPYVTSLLSRGDALSNENLNYPYSNIQREGMDATVAAARGQGPMIGAANQLGLDTLEGKYLDPSTNPYLRKTFDQAARGVTDQYTYATKPGTDAAFNRAGAFGGSAWDQANEMNKFGLGENLDDLATQIFGGNYQQERQRQYGQQSYTPGILQQQYTGANALMGVGDYPYKQLQFESGLVSPYAGMGPSTTTAPNPNYSSPFANLVGLGMINSGGGSGFGGFNPGAAAGFGPNSGFAY